jgi:hypothetical protein
VAKKSSSKSSLNLPKAAAADALTVDVRSRNLDAIRIISGSRTIVLFLIVASRFGRDGRTFGTKPLRLNGWLERRRHFRRQSRLLIQSVKRGAIAAKFQK